MDNTNEFYTNSGDSVEFDICDYVRIKLIIKRNVICDGKCDGNCDGKYALISKSDYLNTIKYKWYLGKDQYPMAYKQKGVSIIRGKSMKMHKFIYRSNNIPIQKGYVIDHINHDKLDNRKDNLRICTPKENSYNTSKRKNKKFKGVKLMSNGTYCAIISKDGKRHQITNIKSEEEAAKIYDMMAEELFGEYAGKNFI